MSTRCGHRPRSFLFRRARGRWIAAALAVGCAAEDGTAVDTSPAATSSGDGASVSSGAGPTPGPTSGASSNDSTSPTSADGGTTDAMPTACMGDDCPTTPADLTVVALSPYQVQLGWSPSAASAGIDGYAIAQDGESVATTSQTTYLRGGLAPETTYEYSVAAFDINGDVSAQSRAVSVTTPAANAVSELASLAASMQPGEWAQLETGNFGGGNIFLTDDNGSITEFSNEANWDPIGRRIYIIGTARGQSAEYGMINQMWVQYSELTNEWTRLPDLPFYLGFHSYDHAAVDAATGDYYLRVVGSQDVWRFSADSGQWSPIANVPISYESCCNALDYFPEMESIVFTRGDRDGNTEIFRYNAGGDDWTRLAEGTSMVMGEFHDIAEYSAVHGVLFFGGGVVYDKSTHSELYALNAAGDVTSLASSPIPFQISSTVTVTEPTTGNLLLFSSSEPSIFRMYDALSDAWSERTIDYDFSVIDPYNDLATVATPIAEYDVVAFFKHSGDDSGVYLYKHAP